MSVPASVLSGAQAALEDRMGHTPSLRSTGSVGGGCINPSARLESEDGEAFFLKWNDAADAEMFGAEADGLRALGTPRALRVPEVLGWGGRNTPQDPGWLLLEFIPSGSPRKDYGNRLGEGLAALHDTRNLRAPGPVVVEDPGTEAGGSQGFPEDPLYGWHLDNFIGSLPQENGEMSHWAEFWTERRIEPQVRLARDRGFFGGEGGRVLERLMSRMEEILPLEAQSGPGLLHGDLWSGNFFPDPQGDPVLIDPAVYRGEGEVDLAMMELFGRLPAGFTEGYGRTRPIPDEYGAFRRDLYQLYYLLVHVNLFGGSYEGGSLSAAKKVLAAT